MFVDGEGKAELAEEGAGGRAGKAKIEDYGNCPGKARAGATADSKGARAAATAAAAAGGADTSAAGGGAAATCIFPALPPPPPPPPAAAAAAAAAAILLPPPAVLPPPPPPPAGPGWQCRVSWRYCCCCCSRLEYHLPPFVLLRGLQCRWRWG